jgi:hypothetical protein
MVDSAAAEFQQTASRHLRASRSILSRIATSMSRYFQEKPNGDGQ